MRTLSAFVAMTALGLAGCRAPPAGTHAAPSELTAEELAAVRATSERWITAAREGHWGDVAATYTEDAVLWFPGVAIEGRDAILEFFQGEEPYVGWDLIIEEIEGRGDLAWVSGYVTVTPEGGEARMVGRYLDVRHRQPDGTWLFHRDMVNPTPPPRDEASAGGGADRSSAAQGRRTREFVPGDDG